MLSSDSSPSSSGPIHGFESAEPFRMLVEAVKDYAIFLLDVEGNVATWNIGAERTKGYTADEIIGTHFSRFYTPDDRAQKLPQRLLARAVAEGQALDEGWRVRKDGGLFWADVVITPLYDHGELCGYGKVTRDLTARRHIESLQRNESRMQEFLAMLSHELRNPLAPVLNALRLLRRNPDLANDPNVGVIDRQITHMSRLVDDLLDIGRITRGKILLQRKRHDLNRLVTQAVEASQALVDARGHALDLQLAHDVLAIDADETRIVQILANLIGNAAKFTPEGGSIVVSTAAVAAEVEVRVRDTGVGIPAATLREVFDLFVQGDRGLDRAEGGLGIGLTLVRRLADMHGGSVSASSEGPGKGSEFVVRLPRAADVQPETDYGTNEAGAGAASSTSLRIVVVDDNRDFAATLSSLLELSGHEVAVVNDGLSAFRLMMDYRPDVVLMDIGLPGMNGYELARKLRSTPELANKTLIALTGYGQPEDRQRVVEAGFDKHLVKPIDADELLTMLERLDVPA